MIKPTVYLEIVQGVAALGSLNEWTSGSSGMEARAKEQLEGVHAAALTLKSPSPNTLRADGLTSKYLQEHIQLSCQIINLSSIYLTDRTPATDTCSGAHGPDCCL
jgi:hypothetical protein